MRPPAAVPNACAARRATPSVCAMELLRRHKGGAAAGRPGLPAHRLDSSPHRLTTRDARLAMRARLFTFVSVCTCACAVCAPVCPCVRCACPCGCMCGVRACMAAYVCACLCVRMCGVLACVAACVRVCSSHCVHVLWRSNVICVCVHMCVGAHELEFFFTRPCCVQISQGA